MEILLGGGDCQYVAVLQPPEDINTISNLD